LTNAPRHSTNEATIILKTIWHRKHRWLGHENLPHDIIKGIILGKATCGSKRRDYGQLKDLISDR